MERKRLRCVEDPRIAELAEDLRLISDPNRLRILCMLLGGERCVCEVERYLGISQQLASHHLNQLKERGFLACRREGTSSYYSVEEKRLKRTVDTFNSYVGKRGACGPDGLTGEGCDPLHAVPSGRTGRKGR